MDHERATGIPSGLIACRFGGAQLHIEEITPRSLTVCHDMPLPDSCRLELSFYHPENGAYHHLSADAQKDGQTLGEKAAGSVRFVFDDAACAEEIRRTLRIWSEYVNMRLSGEAECFAEKYLGYPQDTDAYCESMEEQYRLWFSHLQIDAGLLCSMECALVLELPSLWKSYIAHPFPLFLTEYAKAKRLPEDFFASVPISRLYIGSEQCFHLFPDEDMLAEIVQKAKYENIALSFSTPVVHQSQIPAMRRRLDIISALYPNAEIIANDWGMLNILNDYHESLTPVFGTLINRFRRDARLKWKAGIRENTELLSKNALNDASFINFLLSLGMQRYEYACSPEMHLPEGKKSLHFPFYATNTSAYCPLKAYIESGSRGRQCESDSCPAYCEDNAFLYPKSLNMIHRMRSIFALEEEFPDAEYLRGFDRLVFNF